MRKRERERDRDREKGRVHKREDVRSHRKQNVKMSNNIIKWTKLSFATLQPAGDWQKFGSSVIQIIAWTNINVSYMMN